MKLILKKDILIPAGTEFSIAPDHTAQWNYHKMITDIKLDSNHPMELYFNELPEDWFNKSEDL